MAAVEREVGHARQILREARRVVVLTGAGISAESGVPTFRGPEASWRSHRPEELSTPEAFARDPRLVWEWYAWRRQRIAACRPNAAHVALARLALRRGDVRILTQNVDGLHTIAAVETAGGGDPDPALPLELHGSIFHVRCTACPTRYEHRDPIDARSTHSLPCCRHCGALLRPDTVWFGEPLDRRVLGETFDLATRADVCLVVGTSAIVQPTASLPRVTQANGGCVIEVNPEPTPLTVLAEVSIRARATEAIPAIADGPKLSEQGQEAGTPVV